MSVSELLFNSDGHNSQDSPRLRVDLSELNLVGHYNLATLIEDQKPRACRALVYRPDKSLGRSPIYTICAVYPIRAICPIRSVWNMIAVCPVDPIHDASMWL